MTDTHPTAATRAGLAAVAGQDGTLAIVAMDQRNTLRRMLAAGQPASDPGELRSFKADVVQALARRPARCCWTRSSGCRRCARRVSWRPAAPRWSRSSRPSGTAGRASRGPAAIRSAPRPGSATWAGTRSSCWSSCARTGRASRGAGSGGRGRAGRGGGGGRLRRGGRPDRGRDAAYRLPGEDPLPDRRRADLIAESARILTETRPDLLKLEYRVDALGRAAAWLAP